MKRREKGLTLIELMVTLAVAIVLLAIGIPAFNTMSARDMSAATVNALVTALQQARMEAISSGAPVRVCALTLPGGATDPCDPAAAPACAQSDWRCGWAVQQVSSGTELRRYAAPRKETTVTASGATNVEFNRIGGTSAQAVFTIKAYKNVSRLDADCAKVTGVTVTTVGQVRSEVKACP
jgi:type IV fimbrial biogenesis protein FimT